MQFFEGGHLDVFSRTNEANYDYSSPDLYCDCEDLVMLEALVL